MIRFLKYYMFNAQIVQLASGLCGLKQRTDNRRKTSIMGINYQNRIILCESTVRLLRVVES